MICKICGREEIENPEGICDECKFFNTLYWLMLLVEHMSYLCSDCKKTISSEEFYYSMNRYRKALCTDHQRSRRIPGVTSGLQEMMRQRQSGEVAQDVPQLRTVKEWIAADFETWEKVLRQRDKEALRRTGEGDEANSIYARRRKK